MAAMKTWIVLGRRFLDEAGAKVELLSLLLARLTVGVVFLLSGWGKLHNLPKVVGFFTSLGLPAPEFQARLVSSIEFAGGLLLLIGLLTRLVSIPLLFTMVVAIATAKTNELRDVTSVFGFNEYAYLALLAVIAARGPGGLSIDALAVRLLKLEAASEPAAAPPARLVAAVAGAFGLFLAGFTGWAALANHNPCDHIGSGFPDLVTQSHSEDDADQAWATCKKILRWQSEGKDPHQELEKSP
jgi:putative oxidoreductase